MGGEVWRQAQVRVCRCSKQANGPLGRQWQRHCCCADACPSPPLHLSSSGASAAPAAWWSGQYGKAGSQRWGHSSRAAAAASARRRRRLSGCQWCCAGGEWAAGWRRVKSAPPPACTALERRMRRPAARVASQLLCCAVRSLEHFLVDVQEDHAPADGREGAESKGSQAGSRSAAHSFLMQPPSSPWEGGGQMQQRQPTAVCRSAAGRVLTRSPQPRQAGTQTPAGHHPDHRTERRSGWPAAQGGGRQGGWQSDVQCRLGSSVDSRC